MPESIEVERYRQLAETALGRRVVAVDAPDTWFLKDGLTPNALTLIGRATREDGIDRLLRSERLDALVGITSGPAWKIDDGVPQYPGDQNVVAVTRDPYPPGQWVDIIVRSYDFDPLYV